MSGSLGKHCEMNSVDTFEKRLCEEIAAVEKEIQAHNQEVEALTRRLEGLKRADELFDSDQAALVELLHASIGNGSGITRERATAPGPTTQRAAANPKTTTLQKQRGHITGGHSNIKTRRAQSAARSASQNGRITRVDMMAAVLRRHPHRSVRELIALLDKEFRWKTNESAVTGKLYTRRDKFVHTQPNRSTNRPVTWSLK
jgi:chromosome segregation ATPase